jgi:hypothetical protein
MNEERPLQGADDAQHDAWLREALRHAPDAATSAPPLLRDAILAEARAAVAAPVTATTELRADFGATPRPARDALDVLAAFWSWLARPPVAAAFASVMAATLIGVMWWDRPLDETMPRPSSPAAPIVGATSAKPEAPMSPAPSTAPATAAAAAAAESPAREAAASALPRAARPEPQPRAKSAPPVAERRREAQPFPVQRKEERTEAGTRARTDEAADAGASMKTQGADRAADEKRSSNAPMSVAAVPPAVTAPMPFPAQAQAALGAARDMARPLAPLRAALATDTERKARTDAESRASLDDDAMQRWLGELDAAAAGRWIGRDGGAARSGSVVTVRIGGAAAATLWLEGSSVTLESHVGGSTSVWRAELAPAAAERLRRTLPRLQR